MDDTRQEEIEEDLDPTVEDSDDDELGSAQASDDEDTGQATAVGLEEEEEEDDSGQTSLEELLAQRAAKPGLESGDDLDIMELVPDDQDAVLPEPVIGSVDPPKDQQEFVCARCHLVKPRVQLSDAGRGLCRDCA